MSSCFAFFYLYSLFGNNMYVKLATLGSCGNKRSNALPIYADFIAYLCGFKFHHFSKEENDLTRLTINKVTKEN